MLECRFSVLRVSTHNGPADPSSEEWCMLSVAPLPPIIGRIEGWCDETTLRKPAPGVSESTPACAKIVWRMVALHPSCSCKPAHAWE